jgi:hypothetical protein
MDQSPSWEANGYYYPPFMEPEGLLLCLQESTTRPYREPDECSPHLPTLFP